MSIVKQERALKAKYRALEKELQNVERQLDELEDVKSGDRPSPEQAKLIKSQPYSFTVHFERSKVLRKVRSPGSVCKSLRRFGTRKEAEQHGKRFTKLHRHKGYKVLKVSQRANAWINWRTGKTNPVLNR